jgi:hypothetical protein
MIVEQVSGLEHKLEKAQGSKNTQRQTSKAGRILMLGKKGR